jgi:hypothetical protein
VGASRDNELHKRARAAVLGMRALLNGTRRHPDKPELWLPALRRAVRALVAATANGRLVLQLRAGAVHVDDEPLLPFHLGEPPFGLLRQAGIGELAFGPDVTPESAERLLQHFAAMPVHDDPERDLAALFALARDHQAELRALADLPHDAEDDAARWTGLPAALPTTAPLRSLVERDLGCNLPALAVRQLLDDNEAEGAPPGDVLERLMARLLDTGDVPTVTWLLGEAASRPATGAATTARITAMARSHCSNSWLMNRLDIGTREEMLSLSALVMELGDDVAERCARAAAAIGHPLARWLGELLGHPMR